MDIKKLKSKLKNNSFVLSKEYNFENQYAGIINLSNKNFTSNMIYMNMQNFKNNIYNFIFSMTSNSKHFNLDQFTNNFMNAEFTLEEKDEESIHNHVILYTDRTILFHLEDSSSIFHELMHLSSITKKMDMGYATYIDNKKYGYALNEGYTELLTQKYFGKSFYHAYIFEVDITKTLEKILDTNRMEEAYFNGDLIAIIKELERYSDKKSVFDFLENLDKLSFACNNNQNEEIIKNLQNCYKFLIDLFIKKCYSLEKENLTNYISNFTINDFFHTINWHNDQSFNTFSGNNRFLSHGYDDIIKIIDAFRNTTNLNKK